jgi:hypothetical protein
MVDSASWWVGDAFNALERYRRDYPAALAELDERYRNLKPLARVAARVHEREPGLSWQHHRVVADCPVDERLAWLEDAAAQGWSVEELKARLQEFRGLDRVAPPQEREEGARQCVVCGRPLPDRSRSDRVTCGDACRKQKSRLYL